MAINPNDRPRPPGDNYRPNPADEEYRRAARLDNELQTDPELEEGPANSGRIALFAVAIALVLGAVFYGLNNSSINNAGTSSTTQTTQSSAPAPSPANPAPSANNGQGVTTGAGPAKPPTPPASNAPSK
jgi:hypothetical protein